MQNRFETINYQYPKPANFQHKNPDFNLFENFPKEDCFAPEIEFLKNVRISTNSVIFNYFKLFRESCISEENYRKYQNWRFYLKFIFPKFNFSKKRFLLITDEHTSNYYHWHAFALKKLLILQKNDLIKNSLLLLPKKYQRYSFVLPSLKKFGIKQDQIIFLPRKSNIKVAELPLIRSSRQHPQIFRELREILLDLFQNPTFQRPLVGSTGARSVMYDKYTPSLRASTPSADSLEAGFERGLINETSEPLNFGDKIYISREKQVLRFIENEKEVSALLEEYGFKKIIAEKFSYEEQIAIFSKTKYLVGPHGAGLTNVLFMPEKSCLLEITTPQKSGEFNLDYYALSSMLGIKYFYQKCQIGEKSLVKDFHQGSLVVDVKKLEENLKLMLQQ